MNPFLKDQFEEFFNRKDTFSLGVCNGCQVMSNLKEIIPGTSSWPILTNNSSGQFEARLSQVLIHESRSLLLTACKSLNYLYLWLMVKAEWILRTQKINC